MNYCKDCKHWGLNTNGSNWHVELYDDDYEIVKSIFEVRYCLDPRLMQFERPLENDEASVVDGSRYYAQLITAENFGCNHFEKKV